MRGSIYSTATHNPKIVKCQHEAIDHKTILKVVKQCLLRTVHESFCLYDLDLHSFTLCMPSSDVKKKRGETKGGRAHKK